MYGILSLVKNALRLHFTLSKVQVFQANTNNYNDSLVTQSWVVAVDVWCSPSLPLVLLPSGFILQQGNPSSMCRGSLAEWRNCCSACLFGDISLASCTAIVKVDYLVKQCCPLWKLRITKEGIIYKGFKFFEEKFWNDFSVPIQECTISIVHLAKHIWSHIQQETS